MFECIDKILSDLEFIKSGLKSGDMFQIGSRVLGVNAEFSNFDLVISK